MNDSTDRAARLRLRAEALNRDWPQGTWVRYWPGDRDDHTRPRVGQLRSPWWILDSGCIVVMVTGYPGCITATHVDPLTVDELAALHVQEVR